MQYWEPVGKDDIEQIHESACRMLEELGMRIRNPEVIAVLLGAGAKKVDDQTVRIPRELVEQAISRAPEQFTVFDRRGGKLGIGGREHHHLIGGTMTEILSQKDLFDRSGIRAPYEDPCLRAQARWMRILEKHDPGVPETAQKAVDEVVTDK